MRVGGPELAEGQRPEEDEHPERRRREQGEPLLLVGPRDRMQHVDDARDERQPDHHEQERQVAEPLALRDGDRDVAEDRRDADEPEDRQHPTQGAPHEQ